MARESFRLYHLLVGAIAANPGRIQTNTSRFIDAVEGLKESSNQLPSRIREVVLGFRSWSGPCARESDQANSAFYQLIGNEHGVSWKYLDGKSGGRMAYVGDEYHISEEGREEFLAEMDFDPEELKWLRHLGQKMAFAIVAPAPELSEATAGALENYQEQLAGWSEASGKLPIRLGGGN